TRPDRPAPGAPGDGLRPGELLAAGSRVLAGTATTPVLLGEVQPEGKRRMRADEWLRGLRADGRPLVLG
ncbi:MAG: methionyl-tRNA formyltransferase, partial [Streptosporangiaceae bacterium]